MVPAMTDGYETWTTHLIAALRDQARAASAKADALQSSLDEYRATHGGAAPKKNGAANAAPPRKARGPGVKTGAVSEALKAAAGDGMTNEQIIEACAAGDVEIKPQSLRAMLWQWRQDGVIKSENGRSYWVGKPAEPDPFE